MRRILFRELPSHLPAAEFYLFNPDLWAAFITQTERLASDAAFSAISNDLLAYMGRRVYISSRGFTAHESAWDGNLVPLGADMQLISDYPDLFNTAPKDLLQVHEAYCEDVGGYKLFDVVSLIAPQDGGRAYIHKIPTCRLDLPLGALNSKRRNEIQRAQVLHTKKVAHISTDLPEDLLPTLCKHWMTNSTADSAAYQLMLWLYLREASLLGFGRMVHVYDGETGQWASSAGFLRVGDHWHFNCYAQNSSRESYSGLFTLVCSHRLLAPVEDTDPRTLLLTCPSFAVGLNDNYDAYKKHIAHENTPAYGLCGPVCLDFDPGILPPYFAAREGVWR